MSNKMLFGEPPIEPINIKLDDQPIEPIINKTDEQPKEQICTLDGDGARDW